MDDPTLLPAAAQKIELKAKNSGTIQSIIADDIGTAAMMLGAGRATKESDIDLAVGLVLHKKVGDSVKAGETLVTIHANQEQLDEVKEKLYTSITIAEHPAKAPSLIYDMITE